ncbi:MAG: hypothetical protein RMK91_05885 [Pseudanabaenaceae cyanobacterium SKYGB_i_bin29]|nr:hypothetical protein [Pseudanabaenaceae cyanobacterium SKYG29]MDW8421381.1 hypothetical protein [Pseudanabaenaceae cyanobacterium SKYGB_i_bin29]
MAVKIPNATAVTIVTIALNIVRSEPKVYFGLGLVSVLWSIVPVYGWANSSKVLAVISTKAYQKLLGVEETTAQIQQRLNRKFWSFWGLTILGGIYIVILICFCAIPFFAFTFVYLQIIEYYYLLALVGYSNSTVLFVVTIFGNIVYIGLLLFLGSLFFYLYGRVSFAELPLAVEPQQSIFGSLARAFALSAGQARKIQMVFSISSLILLNTWFTLPYLVVSGLIVLLGGSFIVLLGGIFLFLVVTYAILNTILQVTKAVIYYDLLCFREGVDLNIEM